MQSDLLKLIQITWKIDLSSYNLYLLKHNLTMLIFFRYWSPYDQTSQLSRFGHETHDFLTDLTTACQSHDFSRFSRNIIIIVRLIR